MRINKVEIRKKRKIVGIRISKVERRKKRKIAETRNE